MYIHFPVNFVDFHFLCTFYPLNLVILNQILNSILRIETVVAKNDWKFLGHRLRFIATETNKTAITTRKFLISIYVEGCIVKQTFLSINCSLLSKKNLEKQKLTLVLQV